MKLLSVFAIGAFALSAAGCVDTGAPASGNAPILRTGSAVDENACLSAVAAQTSNSVMVLSSDFSQANTIVMVGVGPDRAPWKCLVSGGNVAEVSFAGSEGAA